MVEILEIHWVIKIGVSIACLSTYRALQNVSGVKGHIGMSSNPCFDIRRGNMDSEDTYGEMEWNRGR